MEIQVLPCRDPQAGNASARLALYLDHHLGRRPEGIAVLRVGFYGDGAPIHAGLHMLHFQVRLVDGRLVRADGFLEDLKDIFGDRLLHESVARLKEEIRREMHH